MPHIKWTEEKVSFMGTLVELGHSYERMSILMSSKFNEKISLRAVMNKATRTGNAIAEHKRVCRLMKGVGK